MQTLFTEMYKLLAKIFDHLDRGLSPREKIVLVSMLLVISALGMVVAVRYYNYIQKSPEFCSSCHSMGEAYTAWKLSGHNIIMCQECHQLGLLDQNRLLVKFVFTTGKKKPEPHGAVTPWKTCTKCHWDNAAQGFLSVNKSTGHAGHILGEKLSCMDCHSRTVHSFKPDARACSRCHERKEIHGVRKGEMSCLLCHPFSPKKQEDPMPSREICIPCHRKSKKLNFAGNAPMSRLNCYECHKPHNCIEKPANRDCLRCHTSEVLARFAVHRTGRRCTACHAAHSWIAR